MPGAASPWLRGLRGAAAVVCSLKSSSHEVSGVVGETAAVLTGLLFVTLVIISTESGGILGPVPESRFEIFPLTFKYYTLWIHHQLRIKKNTFSSADHHCYWVGLRRHNHRSVSKIPACPYYCILSSLITAELIETFIC